MTKIRKGTDIVLNIKINGSDLHTFSDIKKLNVFITQSHSYCKHKHTHQPTTTSTNICCCGKDQPVSEILLNSLVTSSDSKIVTVDAIFPANMQYVSGVYCLKIQWQEKTDNLIAYKESFTYTIDMDDIFELVNSTEDSTTIDNTVPVDFILSKQPNIE